LDKYKETVDKEDKVIKKRYQVVKDEMALTRAKANAPEEGASRSEMIKTIRQARAITRDMGFTLKRGMSGEELKSVYGRALDVLAKQQRTMTFGEYKANMDEIGIDDIRKSYNQYIKEIRIQRAQNYMSDLRSGIRDKREGWATQQPQFGFTGLSDAWKQFVQGMNRTSTPELAALNAIGDNTKDMADYFTGSKGGRSFKDDMQSLGTVN
jgi:hypothetical protein